MGERAAQLGWALVRVTFGASLALAHGWGKVFGGNIERFAQGVGAMGFPAPTVFAWAASLSELVGGLLVAVGLFTRPAAAMAGFTMAVALFSHRADAYGRMEMALLYLVVLAAAVLRGGGRYSLDAATRARHPLGLLQR